MSPAWPHYFLSLWQIPAWLHFSHTFRTSVPRCLHSCSSLVPPQPLPHFGWQRQVKPESVPRVGFCVSLSLNLNVMVNRSDYTEVCTQSRLYLRPFVCVYMCSLGGERQLGVNWLKLWSTLLKIKRRLAGQRYAEQGDYLVIINWKHVKFPLWKDWSNFG